MLFVAMTYTTMTSNTVIPDKGDEDPRLTFADKLTNYAENNTIPNPIIPMIFHYLDRYFNDLVEDDVDDIFKRVLDLAPDDAITMLRNGLGNYTTHKHLLESIIPAQYYTLDVADTIDMLGESGFINLTLDFAQESDIAFAEGGTVYHENIP